MKTEFRPTGRPWKGNERRNHDNKGLCGNHHQHGNSINAKGKAYKIRDEKISRKLKHRPVSYTHLDVYKRQLYPRAK